MNVGYYFHIPAVFDPDGAVRVPAFHGVFIEELARRAGHVTYYAHEAPDSGIEDHVLPRDLVTAVNLGPRRSGPSRTFFGARSARRYTPGAHGVDVMLVRGASPLLPYLVRHAGVPAAMLLVADYGGKLNEQQFPWWRNQLIRMFAAYYGVVQALAARKALVLAKSASRTHGTLGRYPHAHVVFTSSLAAASLPAPGSEHPRPAPGTGRSTLLYAGRIVEEKGLYELVRATAGLTARGLDPHVVFVGWSWKDPTADNLAALAAQLGIAHRLQFPGYVPAGPALQAMYAQADAYVLPTYAEGGVARTIGEAMAACVPVVTTAIPAVAGELHDGVEALLVPPRDVDALAAALERVLSDDDMRTSLVHHGLEWARAQTNERSVELIVEHLRTWVAQCR